eukprot:6213566-Pleurochrysis_carterae.AAC.4
MRAVSRLSRPAPTRSGPGGVSLLRATPRAFAEAVRALVRCRLPPSPVPSHAAVTAACARTL